MRLLESCPVSRRPVGNLCQDVFIMRSELKLFGIMGSSLHTGVFILRVYMYNTGITEKIYRLHSYKIIHSAPLYGGVRWVDSEFSCSDGEVSLSLQNIGKLQPAISIQRIPCPPKIHFAPPLPPSFDRGPDPICHFLPIIPLFP